MNIQIQNIIVLLLFTIAIYNIIQHFRKSFDEDSCSSSCGGCGNSINKSSFSVKIKKLN
jgi:uncharacterized membrane protein